MANTHVAIANEVEAWQWDGSTDPTTWAAWAENEYNKENIRIKDDDEQKVILVVKQKHGEKIVRPTDWIINWGSAYNLYGDMDVFVHSMFVNLFEVI